ncbi:MAG: AraC-like DNA-binding protein [Myxococcota bacterium]|jgi:AraC-like DNA-binding protein
MTESRDITLDRGWVIMLRDVGIDPQDVVRRAGLSLDLLTRESSRLSVSEYFGMLDAVEHLAQDPMLPLRLGQSASPEAFSPPIFAALCSSTLAVAVQRIATHKRLIAPMHVIHSETDQGLVVSWEWDDPTIQSPRLLMAMELVFMTQLARIATREPIKPLKVTCPIPLEPTEAFLDFFGVAPVVAPEVSLTFQLADAQRPFLTASEVLWRSFEPELQRRVSKLDAQAPMSVRTRSMLLECLPSGEATLHGTARRLGVSSRTLQRRLADEGVTFREVVRGTRERLARHYLVNTPLAYGEVAFLIGFDEPSSFFRAFREWTGKTPESVRLGA